MVTNIIIHLYSLLVRTLILKEERKAFYSSRRSTGSSLVNTATKSYDLFLQFLLLKSDFKPKLNHKANIMSSPNLKLRPKINLFL